MKLTEIMISIFVNMPELDTSATTIKRMLNIFEDQEVIYNSIEIMNISNDTQRIINRPQVVNKANNYRVDFLPDRIDWIVNFNYVKEQNQETVDKQIKLITEGLKKVMKEFSCKTSRMALNTQYLCVTSNRDQFTNFISNIDKLSDLGTLSDWSIRKSFKKNITLNDKDDILNINEELNYVQNGNIKNYIPQKKFTGFYIHYDINTALFNKGERHSENEFNEFIEKSLIAEKTIKEKTEELLCQQ